MSFLFFLLLLFPTSGKIITEAQRLKRMAQEDIGIGKTASIKDVSCSEYACRFTFRVKDEDGSRFQRAVFNFLQANPELGSSFGFEDDKYDRKISYFIIYKEKPLED